MTFEELKKSVKELKYPLLRKIMGNYTYYCDLFDRDFFAEREMIYGLYIIKNNDEWEVYSWDTGRGLLEAKFTSEDILYEYIYCRYKEIADDKRDYFRTKTELIHRLQRYKIPASEYSFYGGMGENCMCVEKNTDIKKDTWEVYYSDGTNKEIYGIFYSENEACNFLFYLAMKKYVSKKKRWW